jgi:MerR family transcriptional regulator/heat shock protein HspR
MAKRDRPRAGGRRDSQFEAVYVISVAAELAGVHPQTLRIYERKGLLQPERTSGNTRRYSAADIARLQRIQELTQSVGVNLAGAKMILDLEEQLLRMRVQLDRMAERMQDMESEMAREMRALVSEATALVPVEAHRSLADLWSEYRRKGQGAKPPIEMGPAPKRPGPE